MSMSPAPLQIASLIRAGMSREPSMEAGTTDWQASGILVARLDRSTLIFCAAIGGSDHDATRIRISRLVLRFSPKVLHPAPVERTTKVNRSIAARAGFDFTQILGRSCQFATDVEALYLTMSRAGRVHLHVFY